MSNTSSWLNGHCMQVKGRPSTAEGNETQIREDLLTKIVHLPRETADGDLSVLRALRGSFTVIVWRAPRKFPSEAICRYFKISTLHSIVSRSSCLLKSFEKVGRRIPIFLKWKFSSQFRPHLKFEIRCHMIAYFKFSVSTGKLEVSKNMASGIIINDVEAIALSVNQVYNFRWDFISWKSAGLCMVRRITQSHGVLPENICLLDSSTAVWIIRSAFYLHSLRDEKQVDVETLKWPWKWCCERRNGYVRSQNRNVA